MIFASTRKKRDERSVSAAALPRLQATAGGGWRAYALALAMRPRDGNGCPWM